MVPHEPVGRVIDAITSETLEAFDVLVERELFTQALTVLYAAIEGLTWLATICNEVTGDCFVSWTEAFFIPSSNLGCSGRDLYGARCGLLHQRLAGSTRSRLRGARDVFYVVPGGEVGSPRWERGTSRNGRVEYEEVDPPVRIDISDLRSAFEEGARRFVAALEQNPELRAHAQGRCHMLLAARLGPAESL